MDTTGTGREALADIWKLCMKYNKIPGRQDDEEFESRYWDNLIMESDRLMKKYKGDPVLTKMIMGFIEGVSEKSKRRK